MQQTPKTTLISISILLLVSSAFVFLAAQNLGLPGYHSDEGFYAVPALNMLHGPRLEEPVIFHLRLFGRKFPVMNGIYFGSTQSYLLIPFFKVFGGSYRTSRLLPVLLSFFSLWLTWYFCFLLFDQRVAYIATILMAFNASFVLWSRVGLVGEGPILVVFSLTILILLIHWHRGQQVRYLYVAAFLSGLGVYTKINLLYLLLGLVIAYMVLRKKIIIGRIPAGTVFCFFLAGLSPLVIFNMLNNFPTVKVLLDAVGTTRFGVDNFSFSANFILRVKQFISMLGGGAYYVTRLKTPNPFYFVLFSLSYGVLGIVLLRTRAQRWRTAVLFLLIVQAVLFLGNCFTTSTFQNHHLFLLYPFPFITIALALLYGMDLYKAKILAIAVVSIMISADLHIIFKKYAAMRQVGERAEWSAAIYALTEYLEKQGIHTPLVVGYAVSYNVEVISHGRVIPKVLYLGKPVDFKSIADDIRQGNNRLILFASICYGKKDDLERQNAFVRQLREEGFTLAEEKKFSNYVQEPVYELFTVRYE